MKTLEINKYGLRFCRGLTVVLLIISIVFKLKELVVLTFLLMFIPAVFSVKYSPFYLLYIHTIGKLLPVKFEEVETAAIRFAQGFGATLLLIGLFLLYFRHSKIAGWMYVGSVAAATAFGAGGLCIGALIYKFFKWMIIKCYNFIRN